MLRQRSTPSLTLAFALATLVAGCATATSDPSSRASFPTPLLREYTAAERQAVLAELERLGPESTVERFLDDYGNLREQVRELKK